ncbi:MAG: UDP-diphosphatase [Candidatus Ryanbacteria bacterium CG10_big_fil_rev_8_21_14_0_10_43_42]|uniref:Undecaprenyl-diphosphatase n=1 Tax=Candidatus Ryanbacteria bacterium CG10_big_fil_rev_8_21_14_0_10_43_42 TaxID=1974864 RepID=A0A2M8KWZ1_9BACT|nr:MAG: UDP-diphosphatase [Candidatus Ryanbacteria bacterium CG10_big_fil_rev_8_21_14_0_10_43_42]
MFEAIILGTIQGVTEWLPISSEGITTLVYTALTKNTVPLEEIIRLSLFLHGGTFLAALVYFWKDVRDIILALFWREKTEEIHHLVRFLIIATGVSGSVGLILFSGIKIASDWLQVGGSGITGLIGMFLIITGVLQLTQKKEHSNIRETRDLTMKDALVLGVVQGCAVLPGLSRSGITVAALLFRSYATASALRVSFLMSLPIVLGGNILLNSKEFAITPPLMAGFFVSFFFGFLTINGLLKLAQKINFGYFALGFGVLALLAAFI